MPARFSSITLLLRPSRQKALSSPVDCRALLNGRVKRAHVYRLIFRAVASVAFSALTATSALSSDDQAWLTRNIPPVIEDLLKDETETASLQGLFSPRLIPDTRLSLPGAGLVPAAVPALPPSVTVVPESKNPKRPGSPLGASEMESRGMNDSKNGTGMTTEPASDPALDILTDFPELPEFPVTLLPRAPAELGRVAAPAEERKGVAEPVFLKEMWTFSTPVDRITPLKNELGANGRFVHDLPSTLSRFDHLSAEGLPSDHWLESARLHRLPPEALYAVALQESGLRTADGRVAPWPWTLNCNAPCPHGPMRFASKQAASEALEKLLKAGWRNIDIGAMQVNYRAHAKRFASYDLLDPRINVIVGGVILREAVQQAGGNLRAAYGLYHVGVLQADNAGRAAHYSSGVQRWAARLKQPGTLNLAKR